MNAGILEIDIHGMNQDQAQVLIDSTLKAYRSKIYRIRVIHGYHGGTNLKRMLEREYRNYDEVLRIEGGSNPGETYLVLREY